MFLMPRARERERVSTAAAAAAAVAGVAFAPRRTRLPSADTIRTLRILNSKLQNMLSGRYKSKVGPSWVPEG